MSVRPKGVLWLLFLAGMTIWAAGFFVAAVWRSTEWWLSVLR